MTGAAFGETIGERLAQRDGCREWRTRAGMVGLAPRP